MRVFCLLTCCVAALSLSALTALFSMGHIEAARPAEIPPPPPPEQRISLHPEQSRAVENLLREILARQADLERKEQSLQERSALLQQEQVVLERMREELESAHRDIEKRFTAWDREERSNTRKLAEFVSKMDAQHAAQLLSEMDVSQAARILAHQGERQAGAIMDAAVGFGEVGIERALSWSEAIRRLRNDGP